MSTYVLCLKLHKRPCLVVGGGEVAERKVRSLHAAGACITIIAREVHERLRLYAEKHEIQLMLREVREEDAKGKSIVIAATNDRNVNLFIAEQARQAGALVNVADSPEDSDFFVPATINRGHLTIAITTNGKIPALSRRIKENLEKQFGNEYESYLQLLEPAREAIYSSSTHSAGRKAGLIEELLDLPLLPLLKEKKHGAAQQTVQDFLRKHGV